MEETSNAEFPESLPLKAITAAKSVVVVRIDRSIISEHHTTPDAVRSRLRFSAKAPQNGAAIFRRMSGKWVKY
jgi:hypothetical protein